MLKLVSFDVWDTLLSIKVFYKSISEELSKITGKSQTVLENELFKGYREVKALRRFGKFEGSGMVLMMLEAMSKILKVDVKALEEATINAVEKMPCEKFVISGAREILALVKSFGLKTAIIGNVVFWPGNYNKILLEKTGLSKFIDDQFYADELGVSKPKPEIFTKALSKFNVKPKEALHVGDSLFEDFVGAVLSHMNAALIDKHLDKSIKLSGGNAYIIPNIKALEEIIKELSLCGSQD